MKGCFSLSLFLFGEEKKGPKKRSSNGVNILIGEAVLCRRRYITAPKAKHHSAHRPYITSRKDTSRSPRFAALTIPLYAKGAFGCASQEPPMRNGGKGPQGPGGIVSLGPAGPYRFEDISRRRRNVYIPRFVRPTPMSS